jgi:5'(3')-deoxyribonucleotidase
MRIFLDLDCVLCDFIKGVAKIMGISHDVLLNHHPSGSYGFGKAVAAAYRTMHPHLKTEAFHESSCEFTFWRLVQGRADFWANLAPFEWSAQLVALARRADPNFRFLSAPSDCEFSLAGKHQWITRMGWEAHRLIPTQHKSDLAMPGRILVDDHDANIEAWRAAGGIGILWPAPHNKRHKLADVAWKIVRQELEIFLHRSAT